MTDITMTYSEEELAWVSDELLLHGNIILIGELKTKGLVLVRKKDDETGEMPTVLVSEPCTDFNIKLCYHDLENVKENDAYTICIYTSEEPTKMQYACI